MECRLLDIEAGAEIARAIDPNPRKANRMSEQSSVRTAVIPAGGRGTRMRPVTRVVPKEMLPIGTRPMLEYAVLEAAAAGVEEICIVVAPWKERVVREYLEGAAPEGCRLRFRIQPEPLGLMDAVGRARDVVDGRPFALLLPDNVFEGPPPLRDLSGLWREHRTSVLGLVRVAADDAGGLGDRAPLTLEPLEGGPEGAHRVSDVGAAKRALDTVASDRFTVGVGRYIFEPEVFAATEALRGSVDGELDDVQVLRRLARQGRLLGRVIRARYHDVGNPVGYWRANRRLGPAATATGDEGTPESDG